MSRIDTSTDEARALDQRIAEKIAAIASIEEYIPAVIIIHDIRDWSVVHLSARGLQELNVSLQELQKMGVEYHQKYFNPEDSKEYVPKILGLIERNNDDESISHFQQVRLSTNSEWVWHLSSIKILLRDAQRHPILTLSISVPIDAKHHWTSKIERLLEENNFLRRNSEMYGSLTTREKMILQLMAVGHSSREIAAQLYISETTAETHRKNIKKKLNVKNTYEIIRFAQAFDMIRETGNTY